MLIWDAVHAEPKTEENQAAAKAMVAVVLEVATDLTFTIGWPIFRSPTLQYLAES